MNKTLEEIYSSSLYKNMLDAKELKSLKQHFGRIDIRHDVLELNEAYFEQWRLKVRERQERRGEIVLAALNGDRKVLLHTKSFYPNGIYRLPTGGIRFNEPVLDALQRETLEETGFKVIAPWLLAISLCEFCHEKERVPFISYIFKLSVDDDTPVAQDEHERITGFKWVPPEELDSVSIELTNLSGEWRDWGNFRAIAHKIVAEKLSDGRLSTKDVACA